MRCLILNAAKIMAISNDEDKRGADCKLNFSHARVQSGFDLGDFSFVGFDG